MSHGIHKGGRPRVPGDPVLWDGCDECEERGADPARAIGNMDSQRFREACQRAWRLQTKGLDDLQKCEAKTLWVLAAVLVQLGPETLPQFEGVMP